MNSVTDEETAPAETSPLTSMETARGETYSGLVAPLTGILGAVLRFPRSKCSSCHKRRILFEVRVSMVPRGWEVPLHTISASPRVCAVCANLR